MSLPLNLSFYPTRFTGKHLDQAGNSEKGPNTAFFEFVLLMIGVSSYSYTQAKTRQAKGAGENGTSGDAIMDHILMQKLDASPNVLYLNEVARYHIHDKTKLVDQSLPIMNFKRIISVPRASSTFSHELGKISPPSIFLVFLLVVARFGGGRFSRSILRYLPFTYIFMIRLLQSEIKLFGTKARLMAPAFRSIDEIIDGISKGETQIALTWGSKRWLTDSRVGKALVQTAIEADALIINRKERHNIRAVIKSGQQRANQNYQPYVVSVTLDPAMKRFPCKDLQYIDTFEYGWPVFLQFPFKRKSKVLRKFNAFLSKAGSTDAVQNIVMDAFSKERRIPQCKYKQKIAKSANISLQDVTGIVYALCVIYACSIGLFILLKLKSEYTLL